MKNITKRLMAMFLAVMMLATLLPLSVFAVDESEEQPADEAIVIETEEVSDDAIVDDEQVIDETEEVEDADVSETEEVEDADVSETEEVEDADVSETEEVDDADVSETEEIKDAVISAIEDAEKIVVDEAIVAQADAAASLIDNAEVAPLDLSDEEKQAYLQIVEDAWGADTVDLPSDDAAAMAVGDHVYRELEPNDRPQDANVLRHDYTVNGTLGNGDLLDFYYIKLTSTTEITVVAVTQRNYLRFGIFDKNGKECYVAYQYLGYEDGYYSYGLNKTLSPGEYTLVFLPSNKNVSEFSYTFYAAGTHVHTGGTATCKSYAVCKECGSSYGSKNPNNHVGGSEIRNWREATTTSTGYTGDSYCLGCGGIIQYGQTVPKVGQQSQPIVVRVAGSGRCETAVEAANRVKLKNGVSKFNCIVMASGDNFADALAGSYLATLKDAPILLYRASAMDMNVQYIRNNLASGGTVYLLGGTAAIPSSAQNTLSSYGINVKRLAGTDRFGTNLQILRESGFTGGKILVCTSHEFADSLSASAVGLPIMLVHKQWTSLSSEYRNYLSGKYCEFIIIGGNNAVNSALENELWQYGSVTRLAGDNRYDTSLKVANYFFPTANTVALAYGRNFPDGLCGGPLAFTYGGPLLLTENGQESYAANYVKSNPISIGYILGDVGVVSNATVNRVFY